MGRTFAAKHTIDLSLTVNKFDKRIGTAYNTNMDIVIDTNVIVSALQSSLGYSFKLISMLPEEKFRINISVPLVLEYEAQLKKHLSPAIFSSQDIDDFIDYICRIGKKTPVYYLWRPFLKDPFDDHVLELALASQSSYIITFNKKDYSGIGYYGITAVTPGEFLSILEERR